MCVCMRMYVCMYVYMYIRIYIYIHICRDSWNSYLTLINRSIVPKVGAKFELVEAAQVTSH